MAFEARIARGDGVEAVFAARADRLERALTEATARGCAGIVSFGTAGGRARPGARRARGRERDRRPFGRVETDAGWSARLVAALHDTPVWARVTRGTIAAVGAPVISEQDKTSLHRAKDALAVDMESHIAAAFAAARGVPFAVCRAIVDPAWRTLPRAATAGLRDDGSTAILPILRELLKQPSQLGPLLQVASDARAARDADPGAARVRACRCDADRLSGTRRLSRPSPRFPFLADKRALHLQRSLSLRRWPLQRYCCTAGALAGVAGAAADAAAGAAADAAAGALAGIALSAPGSSYCGSPARPVRCSAWRPMRRPHRPDPRSSAIPARPAFRPARRPIHPVRCRSAPWPTTTGCDTSATCAAGGTRRVRTNTDRARPASAGRSRRAGPNAR